MGKIFDIEISKLEEIMGCITAREISQQPRLWRETLQRVEKNKNVIEDFFLKLKSKKIKVIFTGAGTSEFVGNTVVPYLKEIGIDAHSYATTDIVTSPESYLGKEEDILLISCARSGNSPESVATVELAEKLVENLYQIVITCNVDGELSKKARLNKKSLLLLMPEDSNDKGFAMTGSFTCMCLASLMIFHIETLEQFTEYVLNISLKGEELMSLYLDSIKNIAKEDVERIIFLGSASLKGLAQEAALKTLELSNGKVMTTFNSPVGFRHGPKSIVNEETLIIIFLSQDKYTRKYDVDLLREIKGDKKAKKIVVFDSREDKEVKDLCDTYINIDLDVCHDIYLVFNYVLLAQKFAFYKAIELSVSPDNPCPTGEVNRVVKGVKIYNYKGEI